MSPRSTTLLTTADIGTSSASFQDAFTKLSTEPTPEAKATKQKTPGPKAKGATGRENRFSSLEVEDTDDTFEMTPAEVALVTRSTPKEADSIDIFAMEEERVLDDAFAVFCFFEDLQRARKSVRQVWTEAISGHTSLVAVTIFAQSMEVTMHRAEQELCTRIMPEVSPDDAYQAFCWHYGGGRHHQQGTQPQRRFQRGSSPF